VDVVFTSELLRDPSNIARAGSLDVVASQRCLMDVVNTGGLVQSAGTARKADRLNAGSELGQALVDVVNPREMAVVRAGAVGGSHIFDVTSGRQVVGVDMVLIRIAASISAGGILQRYRLNIRTSDGHHQNAHFPHVFRMRRFVNTNCRAPDFRANRDGPAARYLGNGGVIALKDNATCPTVRGLSNNSDRTGSMAWVIAGVKTALPGTAGGFPIT